jgi:SAM-dependent methyltransferase
MICSICLAPASIRYEQLPGFALGLSYDIVECSGCGTSFAVDASPQDWLYTKIYDQPERISGYHRYEQFAAAVEGSRSPLRTLMNCEDVYFAVGSILKQLQVKPGARVLEIGCGLGYLVYALVQAGYSAEGWDLSPSAIATATRRFGAHYSVRNANDEGTLGTTTFDVVIFTSFIEHVTDPIGFVAAAKTLLAPGGSIILSTDNKSFFNPAPVWHSDLPPVHLWWFTELGIATIAKRNKLSAAFFDFSEYNAERPWERIGPFPLDAPTVAPRLTAEGEPLEPVPEAEKWSLFPLSRSLVPATVNAVRRATATFREQRPLLGEPRGRRLALAALLRSF